MAHDIEMPEVKGSIVFPLQLETWLVCREVGASILTGKKIATEGRDEMRELRVQGQETSAYNSI